MKICLKCKQPCDNDDLLKCPKCNGELIAYSKEKYQYYLNNQRTNNTQNMSKEDRMYQDIHTIKNILVLFVILLVITFVMNLIMLTN